MLAQSLSGAHNRKEHTAIKTYVDWFRRNYGCFGLSTWAAVFFATTAILETKIEREKLNWLDDAGREERHR